MPPGLTVMVLAVLLLSVPITAGRLLPAIHRKTIVPQVVAGPIVFNLVQVTTMLSALLLVQEGLLV